MGPAEYELPVYAYQLEALAFFDHVVKGVENGYAEQARVRAHAGRWISWDDFPVASAQRRRLHLSTTGLSDSAGEGTGSWLAAPRSAVLLPGLELESAYSLALEKPCVVAGPVRVNLQFSCNEIDSHVIGRLGRWRDGQDEVLALGHIRPAQRLVDEARSTRVEVAHQDARVPLVPGEPVSLSFSLTPLAASFQAGDRLTFRLGSRSEPMRGQLSQGRAHFDFEVPPYFARNTIHYGEGSWVELDFV